MRKNFTIDYTLHENCEKCLQCAEEAMATAIYTGSVGGSTEYSSVNAQGHETLEHSAKVSRNEVPTH